MQIFQCEEDVTVQASDEVGAASTNQSAILK